MKKNIATIIPIIFLVVAFFHKQGIRLPYAFFQLLRFVVCGTTAYLGWLAYENDKEGWIWPFGVIAVLFNPLVPFYLGRELWQIVDLITAVVLAISIFTFKLSKNTREK